MTSPAYSAETIAFIQMLRVGSAWKGRPCVLAGRAAHCLVNSTRSLWAKVVLCGFTLLLAPSVRGAGPVSTASEAALDAALSGGGLVTLVFDGDITITNTKAITADTTLDATGYRVTIGGGNMVRIFTVSNGVSLTLSNLTMANGLTSSNGGAIYNLGSLTAYGCVFTNNRAVGSNGIAGADGNDFPETNGSDGHSGTSGTSVSGGAIYNSGSLALTGCTFTKNSAMAGSGGNGGRGGNGGWLGGNGGNGGGSGLAKGGAIFSTNSVLITNCTFAGNVVVGGGGGNGGSGGSGANLGAGLSGSGRTGGEASGAGVYAFRKSVVVNSTFSANTTGAGKSGNSGVVHGGWQGRNGESGGVTFGGGLCNLGTNVMINCTFYTNTVTGGGGGNGSDGAVGGNGGNGGSAWGGGFCNWSVASVTNCTFSTCGAYGGAGGTNGLGSLNDGSPGKTGTGSGGNIVRASGTFILKNSIIAYQTSGGNGYGTITDAGYNLSSDSSITLSGTGSRINTDPKLGPLAENGGPTKTTALLTNSPAIDAGDTAASPPVDQRGVSRPVGPASDIGAFEYGLLVRGRVSLDTNGVAGVQVTTEGQSATTDADGNYLLVVQAGEHVITPAAASYDFDPPSRIITVTADTNGVNFSAIQLFVIGGRVLDGANGVANVTVNLGTEAMSTTDSNGNYSFSRLSAGDYELSASLSDYEFDPPMLAVTVGPDDMEANFHVAYTISGRVLDGTNGLGGVTVSADTKTALTDTNGNYTIVGVHAGNFFVFASLSGYTFSPAQQVSLGPSVTNLNFSVESRLYTISGRITEGGVGLGGVQIFGSRTTDANGNYHLSVQDGNYVLTPFKPGYGFIPRSYTVTVGPDATNLDFVAGPYISSFMRLTNGDFRIFLYAPAGQVNTIQASTNLIDWVSVFTNSGPYQYLDKDATQFPFRFYRSARPQ